MNAALRILATGALLAAAAGAFAQDTAAGLWKTVDDATGREKSLIRITSEGGVYTGRIEKLLDPDRPPTTVCEKCTDDRKGQPLIGLEIIRHAKAGDEPGVYTGGDIVDPNNGKTYKLRLQLLEGGHRLQVRGYIGPFFRSQVWERAE